MRTGIGIKSRYQKLLLSATVHRRTWVISADLVQSGYSFYRQPYCLLLNKNIIGILFSFDNIFHFPIHHSYNVDAQQDFLSPDTALGHTRPWRPRQVADEFDKSIKWVTCADFFMNLNYTWSITNNNFQILNYFPNTSSAKTHDLHGIHGALSLGTILESTRFCMKNSIITSPIPWFGAFQILSVFDVNFAYIRCARIYVTRRNIIKKGRNKTRDQRPGPGTKIRDQILSAEYGY